MWYSIKLELQYLETHRGWRGSKGDWRGNRDIREQNSTVSEKPEGWVKCCWEAVSDKESVQLLSCVWPFATHGLQRARLPCPSPTPGAWSNLYPSNQWCHPTLSSSVVPFSSCLQSFPASGSLQMSQFFSSGGQSISQWRQHQCFQWIFRIDFL